MHPVYKVSPTIQLCYLHKAERSRVTYFNKLLLRPYLNGLYLLRSLSLNTVCIKKNLKAKELKGKEEKHIVLIIYL